MEQKEIITHVNSAKIAKYNRDLAKYCELINKWAQNMQSAELMDELTQDMCDQLTRQDITPFKALIIKEFEDLAAQHKATITRKEYKDRAGVVLKVVCKYFDMFMQDVALARQQMDLSLMVHERVPYIKCINGVAQYDAHKVAADNSHQYTSRQELEFIERTKRLYAEIVLFNKDCKRMGGVGVGRSFLDLIQVGDRVDEVSINWDALKDFNI